LGKSRAQIVNDPTAYSKRDAMERILSEPVVDGQEPGRLMRIYEELQDLDAKDFPKAIAHMRQQKDQSETACLIASLWAERDPVGAATWLLETSPSTPTYFGFHEAILGTWGQTDSGAMFDWVNTHVRHIAEKHRAEFAFGFAKAAVKIDPQRGRTLVEAIAPRIVGSFYMVWAQYSPAAAGAAVLNETDESVRNEGITEIARFWNGARYNPIDAMEWASRIPDPDISHRAMVSIGATVSHRDKRAGADLLAELPQTNQARKTLGHIVWDWSNQDLPAAFQWALSRGDDSVGRWAFGQISAGVKAAEIEKVINGLPPEQQENARQRWRSATAAPKLQIPSPAK
jgi:hypothetical protein